MWDPLIYLMIEAYHVWYETCLRKIVGKLIEALVDDPDTCLVHFLAHILDIYIFCMVYAWDSMYDWNTLDVWCGMSLDVWYTDRYKYYYRKRRSLLSSWYVFQLSRSIWSGSRLQWYHIFHLVDNIGGEIPTGGVILLPMIGWSNMILGGEMIGNHATNIAPEWYHLSKGWEIHR